LVAETIKNASSADAKIGDPDIFDLPVAEFVSEEWTRRQAEKIDLNRASRSARKTEGQTPVSKQLTASILIADRNGNVVNYSSSLGDAFGTGRIIPGTGLFLNNLLLGFDRDASLISDPDFPNAPAPGQRPKNYFAPVLVLKDGRPVLSLNASDGPESFVTNLNVFLQRTDFKVPCEGVLEIPRVFNRPEGMVIEKQLYDEEVWRVQLELWGHKVHARDFLGNGQMICFETDSGRMIAESDLRGDTYGAAAI